MTDESATVNFSIALGYPGDGTLNLGFPSQYEDELLSLLDEAGVQHESVLAHSEVADQLIEAVKAMGPEGIAALSIALASIVRTIARRNVGKQVVIDGVKVNGVSEKFIAKILQQRVAELQDRDASGIEQND